MSTIIAAPAGGKGSRRPDVIPAPRDRLDSHAALLHRAVRGALEAAHCAHELRLLLGDARGAAPKSRRNLLAAAELTATDLAANLDELGLALLQFEIMGGRS